MVQKIPMPGVSGGIAMAPDGQHGLRLGHAGARSTDSNRPPADVPGPGGRRDPRLQARTRNGKATARRRDRGARRRPARRRRRTSRRRTPTPLSWPRDLGDLAATARRCSRRSTSRTARRSSTPQPAQVTLRRRPAAIRTAPRSPATASSAWSPTRPTAPCRVIDLASGDEVRTITVGPHLSHPEGIAVDPKRAARLRRRHPPGPDRGDRHEEARGRAHALGRAAAGHRHRAGRSVSVTSGRLPAALAPTPARTRSPCSRSRASAAAIPAPKQPAGSRRALADAILDARARRGIEQAESRARRGGRVFGEEAEEEAEERGAASRCAAKSKRWQLLGRVPVALLSDGGASTPPRSPASASSSGSPPRASASGPNDPDPGEEVPTTRVGDRRLRRRRQQLRFNYLPEQVFGHVGRRCASRPTAGSAKLTPRASRADPPDQHAEAAGRHAARRRRARSSTSSTSCARTAPTTRSSATTRAATATRSSTAVRQGDHAERARAGAALPAARPRLRELGGLDRRPLLDLRRRGLRLRDQELARELRRPQAPVRLRRLLGHLAVAAASSSTRPQKQGISWFNYGEAVAGTVPLFTDIDRTPEENAQVDRQVREVRPRAAVPGPAAGPAGALLLQRRLLGRRERRSPARRSSTPQPPAGRQPADHREPLRVLQRALRPAARERTPCRPSTTSRCANDHTDGTHRPAAAPRGR